MLWCCNYIAINVMEKNSALSLSVAHSFFGIPFCSLFFPNIIFNVMTHATSILIISALSNAEQ